MSNAIQDDLFEIKITGSGKYYIYKFASIAKLVILVSVLISLIHVATTVVGLLIFKPDRYAGYKYLLMERRLLPYYTVIFCIVLYLQLYFYWQVTRHLRVGVALNDEEKFNKAFQLLFRYSAFGLVSVLLSLFYYGFELFTYIIYYL